MASISIQAKAMTNSIVHVQKTVAGSFEQYTLKLESKLGRLDLKTYESLISDPKKTVEVKKFLESQQGSSGLMIFAMYDHGSLLKATIGVTKNAKQYVIGNPLIAATMTEHDVRAALYAPLRILVYQNDTNHVVIEYDLPSSQFGQFHNAKIDAVAKGLDAKVEALLN